MQFFTAMRTSNQHEVKKLQGLIRIVNSWGTLVCSCWQHMVPRSIFFTVSFSAPKEEREVKIIISMSIVPLHVTFNDLH
jgi:hypothetical protein